MSLYTMMLVGLVALSVLACSHDADGMDSFVPGKSPTRAPTVGAFGLPIGVTVVTSDLADGWRWEQDPEHDVVWMLIDPDGDVAVAIAPFTDTCWRWLKDSNMSECYDITRIGAAAVVAAQAGK